ncbi:MAG: hypothetical protein OXN96_13645 [Bryobacterales bacterium]|nr:hypothetical protein [Bryobacterales bacterium]
MSRGFELAANRATDFVTGMAGCLLGAWLVNALRTSCTWILLAFGDAELLEGRFGAQVALPHGTPWILHALQEFGPLLLTVVAFGAAAWLACRTRLAASLASACVAFWLGASLCIELLRYGWASRGPLELLLQSLGVPQGGEFVQRVLAVLLALGIGLLLRSGLRRSGLLPLSAFAAPACLLYFLVGDLQLDSPFLARLGASYVPLALAVAATAAASFPWRTWQKPSLRSAAILSVGAGLAVALPIPPPSRNDSVAWAELASDHWSVRFDRARFTPEARRLWVERADERLPLYRERLGLPSSNGRISVHVTDSERVMRSLGAGRNVADSFALDTTSGAVLMGTPDLLPEDPRSEPLLAMREAWGVPGSGAMALALARYAVGQYEGLGLREAASRISCQEARYTAAAAFGIEGRQLSPLARDAVGGAWVEGVAAKHGTSVLETLYRQPAEASLQLCTNCIPPCETSIPATRPPERTPAYFKGISFSHEGRGVGGYGSLAAGRELARIRNLGANTVALVPYAFTAAPEETSIRFQTLETDARLSRSVAQARRAGLAVMLKPHLWAGRRFHGDISFRDESRFDAWFEDYRSWMLHYARFAQAHGVEVLSVGNELAGLTMREEAWRGLIAQVRRIYRGPVTYAAHWERELEQIAFWDALDYIGVNFYFPIARAGASPQRDSPEILAARHRINAVQSDFQRPVLFTEVGFPALATAASRPWEENSSALDAELQSRCYAIWLEEFSQAPEVKGMFWWKWPSHGRSSPFDPSHRPLAKPALRVLGEWFKRL